MGTGPSLTCAAFAFHKRALASSRSRGRTAWTHLCVALGLYQVGATYLLRPWGSSEADPRSVIPLRRTEVSPWPALLCPAAPCQNSGSTGTAGQRPRATASMLKSAPRTWALHQWQSQRQQCLQLQSTCTASQRAHSQSNTCQNHLCLACDGLSTKPNQLHSTADVLCSGETKAHATTPTSFKEKCWKSGDKLLSPPNTLSPLQEKGCRWTDCDP